jgi:stage V sporulation protein G
MSLEITDVQIILQKSPKVNDKLKCFVNIIFNKIFIIKNLRVIEGSKGFFVVMPNYKKKDGSFQDVAHPLNDEFRRTIDDKVLEAYENALRTQRQENNQPST